MRVAFAALGLTLVVSHHVLAQHTVWQQRIGAVSATCERDPFRDSLVCVVLNASAPVFGIQLGSAHDSASIGFTVGYEPEPGTGIDVRVDSLAPHSIADGNAFGATESAVILEEMRAGRTIRVRFTPSDPDTKDYGEFDLKDFDTALRNLDAFRASYGNPVLIAAAGAPVAAVSAVMPIDGWSIVVQDCRLVEASVRCSVSVTNNTADKRGFRLENVRAVEGPSATASAMDFNYYPRASLGMDKTQGNCDAGATCQVQFSFSTAKLDSVQFQLSVWGASFGSTKEAESPITRMAILGIR